jgi:uncharacterized protein (UPF0303 family)
MIAAAQGHKPHKDMTMSPIFPSQTALQAEAESVIFPKFDAQSAIDLGSRITQIALTEGLGLIVNIRTENRTLYHAATPGAEAVNDRWARRKSNTALMFGKSSLAMGVANRESGTDLTRHGLNLADYADAGGAVPVIVAGVGMVAVVTVSGLPQLDDHALVIRAMRAQLARA